MKYKCPGIIEDWCGDLPAGLGTPEPDTKCQIVTQTQLDRIENQNQMIIDRLDQLLEQKKPTPKNRIPTKNAGCDVAFNLFWSAYPVKKGKKAARNVYMRIPSSKYPMIHADIKKRMENDAQWMEGYIPVSYTHLTLPTNREV